MRWLRCSHCNAQAVRRPIEASSKAFSFGVLTSNFLLRTSKHCRALFKLWTSECEASDGAYGRHTVQCTTVVSTLGARVVTHKLVGGAARVSSSGIAEQQNWLNFKLFGRWAVVFGSVRIKNSYFHLPGIYEGSQRKFMAATNSNTFEQFSESWNFKKQFRSTHAATCLSSPQLSAPHRNTFWHRKNSSQKKILLQIGRSTMPKSRCRSPQIGYCQCTKLSRKLMCEARYAVRMHYKLNNQALAVQGMLYTVYIPSAASRWQFK